MGDVMIEIGDAICPCCGAPLPIGVWPWCPHGHGASGVTRDEIPGGMYFENGFDQPTRFDSHSAHRKALAKRGLEIRAKWAGPEDRHLTRWASVDLEGATALVSRGAVMTPTQTARWPQATTPITVTDLGEIVTAKDLR